jgi:hypothetical protein
MTDPTEGAESVADEMVAVADLPEPLKLYLKARELTAGKISARVLRERQHGAEGRVTLRARQDGVPLVVADRHGERIATTAATAEIDTAARVRVR